MGQPNSFQIQIVLAVLLLAVIFRVADIFVFRLDERWGEILLSKSLTLALVLGVVVLTGSNLRALGLRGDGSGACVVIAIAGTFAVFGLAVAGQFSICRLQGSGFALSFEAIDPKTGLTGSLGFAFLLVVGNVINAMAEEGLFRGLMLPTFESHFGIWKALALQAALFGLWHLVWPAKAVFAGEATVAAALVTGLVLLIGSFIAGLAFGLMYVVTQSLWVPIIVHVLNNAFYNFVHIRTDAGLDKHILVMQVMATLGLVVIVPLLRIGAR